MSENNWFVIERHHETKDLKVIARPHPTKKKAEIARNTYQTYGRPDDGYFIACTEEGIDALQQEIDNLTKYIEYLENAGKEPEV